MYVFSQKGAQKVFEFAALVEGAGEPLPAVLGVSVTVEEVRETLLQADNGVMFDPLVRVDDGQGQKVLVQVEGPRPVYMVDNSLGYARVAD
jgi:hypothetical protein